jgi:hypothetical protein
MISEFTFFYILLIHYLADFGLQTHEQATNKGVGNSFFNKWLFYHVGVYSLIWLLAMITIKDTSYSLTWWGCFYFSTITFVCHYITDWCTSRVGKNFWLKNDFHNGFVIVGFDQILHYIQLYLTFKYIVL